MQVRKTVTEEQVAVPVELRREEAHVAERNIPDRPATGQDVFQEGTIRVPLRGEEAVVEKEAVVTGEVVIGKERVTERQQVTDTVRRERVDVEENYQRARSGFQQHFAQRQAAVQGQAGYAGRTFEQAEPNYRTGFEAGSDPRYAGREFEQIEPDLRGAHETSGRGAGGAWEHLREEIREGFSRACGR